MQHIQHFTNNDYPSKKRKTTVLPRPEKINSSITFLRTIKYVAALFLTLLVTISSAAEHNVEMKNVGVDGTMVFEPAVINIAVGDTVHFLPTDMAHNSESVDGLTPEGSVTWKGEMNKKVSVTIDKEGVYVYQCLPHVPLAMVGVIVAGQPVNLEEVKANSTVLTSKFATNKDRLEKYLTEVR